MSNSAPIIPPGSPLQRTRPDRDSKFLVTVFAVLAVHVLLLSGLLIQGCKRQDSTSGISSNSSTVDESAVNTSRPAPSEEPLVRLPAPLVPQTTNVGAPQPAMAASHPGAPTPIPSAPESPVVTSAIPSPTTAPSPSLAQPAPSAPALAQPVEGETSTTVYAVKQGDTLTRIAKAHGTTVHAIRAANGLKTDRLLVGQKLKVPTATAKPATETAK